MEKLLTIEHSINLNYIIFKEKMFSKKHILLINISIYIHINEIIL